MMVNTIAAVKSTPTSTVSVITTRNQNYSLLLREDHNPSILYLQVHFPSAGYQFGSAMSLPFSMSHVDRNKQGLYTQYHTLLFFLIRNTQLSRTILPFLQLIPEKHCSLPTTSNPSPPSVTLWVSR